MRCRRAETLISLTLDSRLSPGRANDLEAHLAGCPACRSYQARLEAIQKGARGGAGVSVETGYWDGLSARIRARLEPAGPPSRPARRWAWLAVPAAAAALVLVFLQLFRPGPPSAGEFFGPQARFESETLAFLEDQGLAAEMDGLVAADLREATGDLSVYELPDLADDPAFWEGLTDEEARALDRELAGQPSS